MSDEQEACSHIEGGALDGGKGLPKAQDKGMLDEKGVRRESSLYVVEGTPDGKEGMPTAQDKGVLEGKVAMNRKEESLTAQDKGVLDGQEGPPYIVDDVSDGKEGWPTAQDKDMSEGRVTSERRKGLPSTQDEGVSDEKAALEGMEGPSYMTEGAAEGKEGSSAALDEDVASKGRQGVQMELESLLEFYDTS